MTVTQSERPHAAATSGRLFFLDLGGGLVLSANPDGSDLKTIASIGRKLPGLCCMEAAKRALAPARDELRDTDADGLPEIAQTIERFDRNCDFGHAAAVVAGFQDISDHALVYND